LPPSSLFEARAKEGVIIPPGEKRQEMKKVKTVKKVKMAKTLARCHGSEVVIKREKNRTF